MAGEDLDLGDDGGTNDTGKGGKGKKHKPLSKGQKIGVAIGAVTILLIVFQIKKGSASSSSSATASAPIDPQTGYPTGSAEDQAALAQIQASQSGAISADSGGGGGGGYYDSGSGGDSGTDPATGVSYSSEFSTLGAEVTSYQNQVAQWEQQAATTFYSTTNPPPPPTTTSTTSTTTGPTAAQSATLAKLNQELGKDSTINTAAAKKSSATLKKQISAVQSRS